MKYFQRSEFACKCGCGFDIVDYELAEAMDDVREHFNAPVIIISGNRCESHNEKVQKRHNVSYVPFTSKSKHKDAIACDFKVVGVHEDDVADYLEKKYPNKYGIGRYRGRTHLDVRPNKARWDKR